jgi:hypothetical protein
MQNGPTALFPTSVKAACAAEQTEYNWAENQSSDSIAGMGKMRAEKILVILLRISAGVLLLALAPVFFPQAWMAAINRAVGLGELPDSAIVGYLTRSLSAMYAFHGALILYISLDVRRWRPIIICLAALGMVFGAFMLSLDIRLGMPAAWTVCEGPFIFVLGGVMLGLAVCIKRQNTPD